MSPILEALSAANRSAVHLETRDVYAIESERESLAAWNAGFRRDPAGPASSWGPWYDLIEKTVGRGVEVRRARIVSEPVTDYIRYEHEGTFRNIAAGEQVRWLPRRRATDIALPGNDFWLFDDETVIVNYFDGDGGKPEHGYDVFTDAQLAKLCGGAFEAVWERAVPHDQYHP